MAVQDKFLAQGQEQVTSTSDTQPAASSPPSRQAPHTPFKPVSHSLAARAPAPRVSSLQQPPSPPSAPADHVDINVQPHLSLLDGFVSPDEHPSDSTSPLSITSATAAAAADDTLSLASSEPRPESQSAGAESDSPALSSTPDTSLHTSPPSHVGNIAPIVPNSALRLRKTAAQRSAPDPATSKTETTSPEHSPTPADRFKKHPNMFGSTPTASYLPLNARHVGPPTSSYLISWIGKHKMFVIFVLVAIIVSVQILLVGPVVMDMEPVKKLKSDGLSALKPPKWLRPSSESPESWFPSSTGSDGGYAASGKVEELGPNSFPPPLSEVSHTGIPQSQASLYKDSNPHRGELPTYLESLLNREPIHQPPPWPHKAPSITPEIWATRTWTDRSNTEASDAEHPEAQPQEADWRSAPWNGWKPPLAELAKPSKELPRVQHTFEDPTRHSGHRNDPGRDKLIAQRQKMVRNAFIHAWEGYKKYAWGHDELKPVSKTAEDPFNGWGASIVDALDTLLVMDLPAEYDLARQHVRDIDFRLIGGGRSAYGSADGRIPVFETAIRYLGGFVSAYDLSGDVLMRDRAEELAQLILPAFDTLTGVPVGRIRMVETDNQPPQQQAGVILAEAGSLLLEFTRLWQVTGNRTYFDRVQRTTDWLDRNMTAAGRVESLFPSNIYPERNISYGPISFGGMADSYYEYLIKEHQLLGGRLAQYSRMYSDAIEGAKKLLITRVDTVPGVSLLTIGEISGYRYTAKLEHLACFSGGMMGLGSRIMAERADDIELAKGITGTCWWAYNSSTTGIGPENLIFYTNDDDDRFDSVHLPDGTTRRGKPRGSPIVGVRSVHSSYLNRPETIESVFYMWRITGDPVWQERGWQMFASWVTHCMTDAGFSAIYDVNRSPADWADSMESFTFAETFKYYYLLFSPPELISLDEYVFTTEAHPLLAPQNGTWAKAGGGSKKFWDANATEDSHLPSPTSGSYSGGERAQVGGLTNNQKQMLWTQWQTKNSAGKIRDLINGLGGDALKNKLRSLVERAERATSSASSSTAGAPITLQDASADEGNGGAGPLDSPHEGLLLASVAGTSVYEAADGTLEVEFAENTDTATQEAVLQQLEQHYETLDADSAAALLRSIEAIQAADAEQQRIEQEKAMHFARLRSKGIR